jgi:hypothetical protein
LLLDEGMPASPRLALEEMLLVSVYWVELGDCSPDGRRT